MRLGKSVDILIFESVEHFLVTAGNADNALRIVPYRISERHISCDVAGVEGNNNVGNCVFVKPRSFELRKVCADKFHIRISEFFGGLFAFFDYFFGDVKPYKLRLYPFFLPEPVV